PAQLSNQSGTTICGLIKLSIPRGFYRVPQRTRLRDHPEAEMDETVGARKGERSSDRSGYRSGYYARGLTTRVGKLELRVPQDRAGRFSTEAPCERKNS